MRLDLSNPINWRHPLAQDLRALWLAPIGAAGDDVLTDLCGLFPASAASGQWSASEEFGRFHAPVFDGTDDVYTIAGPTDELQITGTKSIFAWVRTTTTAVNREVLALAQAGGSFVGFNFGLSGNTAGRVGLYHSDIGTWREATSGATNDGQWHMIGVTIDAGASFGSTFWLDGQPVGSTTISACTFTSPSLTIGGYPPYRWTAMTLGELRLYGRCLDQDEARLLYEETHPENPQQYADSLNWISERPVLLGDYGSAGGGATPWLYARRSARIIGGGLS